MARHRDVTRAYTLLDHSTRDGVDGIDHHHRREVDQLPANGRGDRRPGLRQAGHRPPVPHPHRGAPRPRATRRSPRYHRLGARLARIEEHETFGELICECELVTRSDVQRSIIESEAKTLDDVRRDTRVGMGPCQGGFCADRVAACSTSSAHPVEDANVALRDFLQERWKGVLSILWGQQLRQERLDELIYLSLFDTEHLPGPRSSNLGPSMYEELAPETTS